VTYNELFASDGDREIAVESNSEIFREISLVCNDVFKKYSFVAENLRQPSARAVVSDDKTLKWSNILVKCNFCVLICQFFTNLDCAFPSFPFPYQRTDVSQRHYWISFACTEVIQNKETKCFFPMEMGLLR
jgi:hypothetical protein